MNYLEMGKSIVATEAQALLAATTHLDEQFEKAVDLVVNCSGNVIVGGVGKPWFIAQKISASMASTGTPSFALHPSDAAHGDIGRVREDDIVILLSNSGASDEITRILPVLKQIGCSIIAITGNDSSVLAQAADIILVYGKVTEACPLGLAPSTSSTVMLALGDALTLTALSARDFGPEDYARFHPAGALGRKLMKVEQIMRTDCPVCDRFTRIWNAIPLITSKKAGAIFILDDGKLDGIFTDGDLRRVMEECELEEIYTDIRHHMSPNPISIESSALVGDAVRLMKKNKIDELPVVSSTGRFEGYIDIQDLIGIDFSVDPERKTG